MGIAKPVLCAGGQVAVRMCLGKSFESRSRLLELAGPEQVERHLVFTRFSGRIAGSFPGGGVNRRLALVRRPCLGARQGLWFELAQATVEIDVEVLLPLPGRIDLIGQRLDLATQTRVLFAQRLNLIGQLDLFLGKSV